MPTPVEGQLAARREPSELPLLAAGNQRVAHLAEVRFPLDADCDGEAETKRLYVEHGELLLNPEPQPFERFLAGNPQCNTPTVRRVRTLMKRPITRASGAQIERLLELIARELATTFGEPRPPSTTTVWSTHVLNGGGCGEKVTKQLVVEPLSARTGPGLGGSGVQDSNTTFMRTLRKWSASYVRGHMLNAKLHGPGVDENLVPISGAFNADMKNTVERHLKEEVSSKNGVVAYEIEPLGFGSYAGTGQNAPIEQALPDNFRMVVESMALRRPGLDATDPANWARTGQRVEFTRAHTPPRSKNFQLSSPPRLLASGVYEVDGLCYPNTQQADTWVVEGSLRRRRYTGGSEQKLTFDEPTNVAAATYQGQAAKLEQIDELLVVTSPAAAGDDLRRLDTAWQLEQANLRRRMGEVEALVAEAIPAEQDVQQQLGAFRAFVRRRGGELRGEGIAPDDYLAAAEARVDRLRVEYGERLALLRRCGREGPERRRRLRELEQAYATYVADYKRDLSGNLLAFWSGQADRESALAELKAVRRDELTNPNREAESALTRLRQGQTFATSALALAQSAELEDHRRALELGRSTVPSRSGRKEERFDRTKALAEIEIDIDIDVDLPPLRPLSPPRPAKRSFSELDAAPRPPEPVKRPALPPSLPSTDHAHLLLSYAKAKLERTRSSVPETRRRAYDAWAPGFLETVKREVRASRLDYPRRVVVRQLIDDGIAGKLREPSAQ